jgi:cell division protein FtsX
MVLLSGLFGKVLFSYGISSLEKRVDVRLSLVTGLPDSARNSLAKKIETLAYVAEVKSFSADDIYKKFQQRHATDFLTLQAVKELNGNPFGSELVVRLDRPTSQNEFVELLKKPSTLSTEELSAIEDVDASHNDVLVARLSSFSATALRVGSVTSAIILCIVLVVLSIVSRMFLNQYTADIAVMRTYGVAERYIGSWLSATYTLCVIFATTVSILLGSLTISLFDNFLGSLGSGAMITAWYNGNIVYIIGFVLFISLAVIHTMVLFFLGKKTN